MTMPLDLDKLKGLPPAVVVAVFELEQAYRAMGDACRLLDKQNYTEARIVVREAGQRAGVVLHRASDALTPSQIEDIVR